MKKLLLIMSLWTAGVSVAFAQAGLPNKAWQKVYGGNKDDKAISFAPTRDGGYIILGTTLSAAGTGDVSVRRGTTTSDKDYWITKLDQQGVLEWEKTYGGTKEEVLMGQVIQTLDGGYMVVGSTYSTDLDITGAAGKLDIWALKLSANGTLDWQKTYGTADDDYGKTVLQTADSGFIIGGAVSVPSSGGGLGLIPPTIAVTMRIDKAGDLKWRKEYQLTPNVTDVISIMATLDGGYAFAGRAGRPSGTAENTMAKAAKTDYLWAKLDTAGNELKHGVMGGSAFDFLTSGVQTADGGFVFCGHTHSQDSNLTGIKKNSNDISDLWIVKIDAAGNNIVWSKSYGGSAADSIAYMAAAPDGGFVIAASTRSTDGDISSPNKGATDVWILKLNELGDLEWEDNYGGSGNDFVRGVIAGADGTIAIVGNTTSTDGDLTGMVSKGDMDFWIVQFEAPQPDSAIVRVKNNLTPKIITASGNLQLEAVMYPRVLSQDFIWSIVPGTGTATIDTNGLVTAGDNGSVWAKAIWKQDASFLDSVEIEIDVKDEEEPEPEFVSTLHTAVPDITIYPNPAATQMFLQSATGHPALTVRIYDLTGSVVYTTTLTENAMLQPYILEVNQYPSGIYLITLDGSGYKLVKQIVVQ